MFNENGYREMEYKYRQLLDEYCRTRDEIYYLKNRLNDDQKYLDLCEDDTFIEFFLRKPERFNKIVSKMRKVKLKKIENK